MAGDSRIEEQGAMGGEPFAVTGSGDRGFGVHSIVDEGQGGRGESAVAIEKRRKGVFFIRRRQEEWGDRRQELCSHFRMEDEIAKARIGFHPAAGEQGAVRDPGGGGLHVEGLGVGDVEPVSPHSGAIADHLDLGKEGDAGAVVASYPVVTGGQDPREGAFLDDRPPQLEAPIGEARDGPCQLLTDMSRPTCRRQGAGATNLGRAEQAPGGSGS